MKVNEGLPFVKFMMLLSSMAPLFLLVGIRGMVGVIPDKPLWISVFFLLGLPFLILKWRIFRSKKSNDTYLIDVKEVTDNKEYLFTYLFTVLLPLYSVAITNNREFNAMIFAISFVIFVLWNLNMHFVNILFAFEGYRVFTIESFNSSILLTTRSNLPKNLAELKVHRLSNTVFIELKNYEYGN